MNELEKLFLDLIKETKGLIRQQKKQSKIFLLMGVVIAATGIYYFILVTNPEEMMNKFLLDSSKAPKDIPQLTSANGFYSNWLISVIPKTIAFIFIEYFAFYFFRLYHNTRNNLLVLIRMLNNREENYVIFSMFKSQEGDLDFKGLLNEICFFENTPSLLGNDNSKLIERDNINENEAKIITEVISLLKTKR